MRFVANVAGRRNDGSRCVPGDVSCRSWGRAAYFGILRDIAFAAAVLSDGGLCDSFQRLLATHRREIGAGRAPRSSSAASWPEPRRQRSS